MSKLADSRSVSGQDPRGDVFSNVIPIVYGSSPAEFYENDSAGTAHCLDMLCGGLRGRRVLDLGCGYGTTTMALSRFAPAEIVAVDPSADMLELMHRIHGEEETDFVTWLEQKGARLVLGSVFDQTAAKFEHRRREFSHGIFRRLRGRLSLRCQSAFELDPAEVGLFDAVAANNVLHWPVNQRRAELRQKDPSCDEEDVRIQAITEAFLAVSRLLRPGGSAVFMEPKDFIQVDDDSVLESDGEVHTLVSHPLFVRYNAVLNDLLQKRYGIERPIPKTTGLFQRSRFREWCAAASLEVEGVRHREIAGARDIMITIQATMPMLLGQLSISHEEKLALMAEVRSEVERTVTPQEKQMPLFVQSFFLCCRKAA